MKEIIKKFRARFKKPNQTKPSKGYVYPIEIPLAGITRDQIQVNEESGYLIIEAEQQVVVEQADRYSPSKMYNSFGFSRSVFLPKGIKISNIDTRIESDRLSIGWPKHMYNQ